MNNHVDAAFRQILAGVAPPEQAPKPMVAARDESRKMLEDAADILCRNEQQRQILQNAFDIGKKDGWIEAMTEAIGKMRAV